MADLRLAGIGMTSARTRDRLVQRLREQGITNAAVLERIRNVPRHIFVDEALGSRAYEDTALPIGFGQTISQPYIVARMTEALLEAGPADNVLEVGTGCGYQAAVLARVFREVYSIERIKGLLERARKNLVSLRIANLRLAHGDGYAGLEKVAPFEAIVVAAAAPAMPEALLRQLSPGGRMVLPLRAGANGTQRLVLVERSGRGFIETELDTVRFVPMEAGKA